ncbi:MAG: hypothetical protein HRT35_00380 [Algicola sp.]|nr:hypothetical protein [Algicola sp.]
MDHVVDFGIDCLQQLKRLDDDVLRKLYKNFINPLKNGYTPDELEGKYKPSWEMAFVDSPMKAAFLALAEKEQLYHYHFGYKFYKDGYDKHYFGKVSDGIIHVQCNELNTMTEHLVFDVCLEHPSPFKIPWDKSRSNAQ